MYGEMPNEVPVLLPNGETITVPVGFADGYAYCIKEAGDDPDVTNGIEVRACVSPCESAAIEIEGGEGVGHELAVGRGQCDDAVTAGLDGTGLVDVDMSGVGTDDGLAGGEAGVDDGGIGLGASGEEVDVGIGTLACLADLAACAFAPLVEAIGETLPGVGVDEVLQHLGMSTIVIVTFER